MRRAFTVVIAVLSLVALPTVADASRRATPAERAAIARSARVPVGCVVAYISDVDRAWASWSLRQPISRRCAKTASSSTSAEAAVFVHRSAGRWRRNGATADCGRPERVPERVWRDLVPACDGAADDGTPLA